MTDTVATESSLEVLHESRVEESEIDELGHLSVPFYEQRALMASHALLRRYALDARSLAQQGVEPTLVDRFTRNYREQFLGATLVVRGGVLGVQDDQVRFYHELINPERDELSATFVHAFSMQATDSRRPQPIAKPAAAAMIAARVGWPEHGQPRSIDLSTPPHRLDLDEARRRDLAYSAPRVITADECNSAGFLEPAQCQNLPYSGTRIDDDPTTQWVFESPDGIRVGLADLESRSTLDCLPRVGERLQVFSADVDIARKTFRRSHWVFNVDSGRLLTTSSVVLACLDLDARRAIEISGRLRAMFERRYHPDLR